MFSKREFTFSSILVLFLFSENIVLVVKGLHPEVTLNFEQRAKLHGYSVEIHPVVTEDDYIVNMYRIPHGLENVKDESRNKSAILIIHGMGGSAMNFIALGKKIGPAYYFADRGFDVWLICVRGVDCQNPKKHKKYDWNENPKYWDYSLHGIGFYDVAAGVDHIINVTGQQKIFTIGHSAGGPELYVLVSERPEYNEKIKIITNYGGATVLKGIDFPGLRFLSALTPYIFNIYKLFGIREAVPHTLYPLIVSLTRVLCADQEWGRICHFVIPGLLGNTMTTLVDEDMVEIIFSTLPRVSIQQLTHYRDNLHRGDFRKFDWGPKKNKKIYGQRIPPLYNLSACTCPSAFFYGVTDSFSTPEDNWSMMELLPNTILDYQIGPKFTHLDFIFAKNATHMLYEPTVKLFKDFDEGRMPPKVIRKKMKDDK